METAPLKSFATWARTALIREVTGRIAVVLAPASPERVEQPKAVAALEHAVKVAGGGDTGRSAVADRVAYTWFNRIIALRFMDANGYNGIGVVSPQAEIDVGQPEILADAKRGNIDSAVVSQAVRETITGLVNGTRRSDDPQGEAYALLLTEYCRHWNRAMPFMFEREGDFTELLIPANLLADDSVLNRAVKVLTEEVCKDVEVIGWLYQFYISERKDEVFASFKKGKKAGAAEIPAATQLFTPDWIVRYLVQNSLGRLWMLNRPNSRLIHQMEYYIAPIDAESEFLKVESPEALTVIDPACGSGHMLTYAFDLLYAIYEEEGYAPSEIPGLILTRNLYGIEIDARAGALAAFALSMKARARQRSIFSKRIKPNLFALQPVSFSNEELNTLRSNAGDRDQEDRFWNQFRAADALGALVSSPEKTLPIALEQLERVRTVADDLYTDQLVERAERVVQQAGYLSTRYAVVVANPPYMGGRTMDSTLSEFARSEFPDSKADLFAMFIERACQLVDERGYVGMITMQSWMFLRSFERLREKLFRNRTITSMAHLGAGAFDTIAGEVVSTTAFVLFGTAVPALRGTYLRLTYGRGEAEKSDLFHAQVESKKLYLVSARMLRRVPGSPIAYWLSESMLDAFERGTPLGEIGEPRQGMATSDNGRFTRLWFEVSASRFGPDLDRETAKVSGCRWFPYNKGGDYRKWYGNQDVVVNWEHDGEEVLAFAASKYGSPTRTIKNIKYYFKPAVSWSKVGTGVPAFRYFPQGFLFDVAGTSIFGSERDLLALAAFGNSNVAHAMLAATSPTMNLEVGTLAQLPIVTLSDEATDLVRELIAVHRADWNASELSWEFKTLDIIGPTSLPIAKAIDSSFGSGQAIADDARRIEVALNSEIVRLYGLESEIETDVPISKITLSANPVFRYGGGRTEDDLRARFTSDRILDLISYAVGCMYGRYSIDEPGFILADQGASLQDYLARVPAPTFRPDADNVIPIVDGDWFEDDIVARFRQFLRVAFGEQHFEENLRFVAESLGVKNLRDYFVKFFYKDHVQRYKKRPIYWLFSSPKGSFNALIYMHRYTPSTVSTVLNEYLREYKAKLESSLQHHERLAAGGGAAREQAAAQKEADRLRKILVELDEYEHDVLYPLASQQVAIDLDDGVKVNYPKFGAALKKIPGLEASE